MTERRLADLAGAGAGLPDRVRPRRPGRDRRRPRRHATNDPAVNAECRGRMAGPSGADPRCGTTATTPGTASPPPSPCRPRAPSMGALAPVLTPRAGGAAQLHGLATRSWPSRSRTGGRRQRVGRRHRRRAAAQGAGRSSGPAAATKPPRSAASTRKLARGNALTRPVRGRAPSPSPRPPGSPSTAAAWTPPSAGPGSPRCAWTWPMTSAFAASAIPLGVGLTRDRRTP